MTTQMLGNSTITEVQPESWLGIPYNMIGTDDTLSIFYTLWTSFYYLNIGSGILIGFVLILIVIGNTLTLGLIWNFKEWLVRAYQSAFVSLLCILIAIGRWVDNDLYLRRYD